MAVLFAAQVPEQPTGAGRGEGLPDWARRLEEGICDFLGGYGSPGPRQLPDDVSRRGVWTVVDCICAAVAASALEELAATLARAGQTPGPATLIGLGRRGPAEWAAFANTILGIAQEIEEGHNLGGHVGVATVMGALAACEELQTKHGASAGPGSGRALVEAVVRAYEITARIEYALMAVRRLLRQEVRWVIRNPHSTWTVLGPALASVRVWATGWPVPGVATGAAACAARERLRHAFRLGLNLAVVSMWDPFADAGISRNFTAGFNAQAGIGAARLAVAGARGSPVAAVHVLEQARQLSGAEAFDAMFEELGREFWISGNYFKPYPSCRYTHPPVEALRTARSRIRPREVVRIDVYTFDAAASMSHTVPRGLTSAKFSIPYILAHFLLHGEPSLQAFEEAAITDPEVLRLASVVRVHVDGEIQREFPRRWLARVVVSHADGEQVVAEPADPLGDERHPLDNEKLRAKWLALLESRYPTGKAERLLGHMERLASVGDVREVTALLCGPHGQVA